MKVITHESQYTGKGAVLALGMFDGVHMGHRRLINTAVNLARALGADSMVCTFDRHPLSVLRPEAAPEALMTLDQKLAAFEKLGADWALVRAFTREFADIDARVYLEGLVKATAARAIVCGENYTFGRGGEGNGAMIARMAAQLGYRAVVIETVRDGGEVVSSTLIRNLIGRGEAQRAQHLLNDPEQA